MSMYDSTTNFGSYLNSGQRNVWDQVNALLNDTGLSGLSTWARETLIEYGDEITDAQFTQLIRERPEYKTRFKAIEVAKKNGFAVPTEAEVLQTESTYRQIYQSAGLPPSFYDEPDDFANLIGNGVSPAEIQTRILDGYTAVRNNPQIQAQLNTLYGQGLNEGDLVAMYLDPDRATSAIELRQSAATLASKSLATGFGQLNTAQAERLAGQGVTAAQAQQGFGDLAAQRSLLNPLASEQGDITTDTALAATFDNNVDAQDQLTRRRSERQARFSGGGGFTSSNKGTTGVGSSN